MQLSVFDAEGNKVSDVDVPSHFFRPVSSRLVNKVFWLLWSHRLQRKGRDPYEGERSPRAGQAAGVAGVVKGRLAKAPTSAKVVYLHLNQKEKNAAFLSALSASFSREYVVARGHRIGDSVQIPIIVDDSIQEVNKAAKLRLIFEKLGVLDDIRRAARRKRRAGKARWRGRAKKEGKGPLIVVSEDKGISRAADVFPGVEVVLARNLSLLDLAPGAVPGRLCIFTLSAIEELKRRVAEDGR